MIRPFVELPRTLAPLGYRNYALYWIGAATSNTGRWIELTGTVWLTYELTGSPILLGLLGVARAVPSVVLGPIGGVIADRVNQRKLLFATQGIGLVASVCLGVLVLTGVVQLWHVYLQVAVQSAMEAFDVAARTSLFPRLVPRTRRAEAATLAVTAGRTSALLGPAIGGIAIAGFGEAAPFLLNAATFPVLMAAVVWMRGVVPRTAEIGSSIRSELLEGLRFIRAAPMLNALIKLELVFGIFRMNPVMITIIGRQALGVSPEGLGVLLSAPALGSMVGITGTLILGQARHQGRFALLCTFAYSASLIAIAASGDYAIAFAVLTFVGLLDVLVGVTKFNIWMAATPGRLRGRILGNMAAANRVANPLAQTQSGFLAAALGGPLAVVSAAAALAIITAWITRASPALWDFSHDEPLRSSADPTVAASLPPDVTAS